MPALATRLLKYTGPSEKLMPELKPLDWPPIEVEGARVGRPAGRDDPADCEKFRTYGRDRAVLVGAQRRTVPRRTHQRERGQILRVGSGAGQHVRGHRGEVWRNAGPDHDLLRAGVRAGPQHDLARRYFRARHRCGYLAAPSAPCRTNCAAAG